MVNSIISHGSCKTKTKLQLQRAPTVVKPLRKILLWPHSIYLQARPGRRLPGGFLLYPLSISSQTFLC
ncbi:hypothetical protein ACFX15_036130 [Malus domestica]